LASLPNEAEDEKAKPGNDVIWTFEPDIVYSALEYLMARITAEFPEHSAGFSQAVNGSMPKATSLQLTISVTTKLARLLQAQAEREIAVNRIGTAIRNSLQLDSILQTAADEVGRPGAKAAGKLAGTWGDMGILSFGGSKLLTAGRGGAPRDGGTSSRCSPARDRATAPGRRGPRAQRAALQV
jgi:hypothetical protein